MKISKLIEILEETKEKRGDMEVTIEVNRMEFQDINNFFTANYSFCKEFAILTTRSDL